MNHQRPDGPDEGADDADLAARARDGDVDAFERLVTRYQAIAFRVAWLVVRDRGEAEDAVQDAFVKAYYALPRFRPGAPLRPWLLRIVANEARNRGRSSRRRDGLTARVAAVDPPGTAASPEAVALDRAEVQVLLGALDRLPDRDRLVVACRFLFELSEAETAEVLGVPPGTVKSRLSRAMTRLRTDLADRSRNPDMEEA